MIRGPFTSLIEVDNYMKASKESAQKLKRLKMTVQFAGETSKVLPKTNPLFRIQVSLPNQRPRDKTAEE